MATEGQEGCRLVEAKDYAAALPKLNKALTSAASPLWLMARSKCHIANQDYTLALHDAEAAYGAAAARGARPLMIEAQYRRAVCLFRLGQPADADICAYWTMQLAEGVPTRDISSTDPTAETNGFWRPDRETLMAQIKNVTAPASSPATMTAKKFGTTWNTAAALRLQIISQLDKFGPEDDKRRITVPFTPIERKPEEDDDKLVQEAVAEKKAAEAARAAQPKEARVDFFQSNTNVTVSVFAKGVPKDEFKAEITADLVRLSHIPGYSPWYEVPLFGQIDPAQSKYTVTPNKVELSLRKAEAVKWPTLRRESHVPAGLPQPVAVQPSPAPKPVKKDTAAPSYPTSSRKGATNWDRVLEDEDVEEKESANEFFKTMFRDATPEQKRAMMKSFTESNGTHLSTSWNDVKDHTVETVPPEGVEVKKW